MKKLITILLTLTVALGTAVTCYAAENGIEDGGYMGISTEETEESDDSDVISAARSLVNGLDNLSATLKGENGVTYKHGSQFDNATKYTGVDVSKYQKDVDWAKVANNTKRTFAFIRVGYRGSASGTLNSDGYYEQNIREAYENGLDVGVYFFTQAITVAEARAEARYTVQLIEEYRDMINLPVIFDFEYISGGRLSKANLSKSQKTKIINAFCDEIEKNGYTAGVYANMTVITKDVTISNIDNKYAVWVARYNTCVSDSKYAYDETYDFWQYSSNGNVSGISGRCDMDIQYIFTPDQVNNLTFVQDSSTGAATISWDVQAGVYGYEVYRKAPGESDYSLLATVRGGTATYTDNDLAAGVEYSYQVRALHNLRSGAVYGEMSPATAFTPEAIGEVVTPVVPAQVSGLKVTAKSVTSVSLEWDAVEDATEYYIYEKQSDGSYKHIKTITDGTFCKITGLKTNTEHAYKVSAVNLSKLGDLEGELSDEIVIHTMPSQVKNVTTKNVKTITATLKWTKVANASGYIVFEYNADTDSWNRVGKTTTNSYNLKKLAKGSTHNYKVQAYKKWSSGTLKGSFSAELSLKTKNK